MSFLGLGGNPAAASGGVNQAKVQAAEAELDMVSDMFNRLVESCHTKCIGQKYSEGEINKGEALCLDRCVAKYFEVNTKVGEHMQKMGAQSAAGGAGGGFMPR